MYEMHFQAFIDSLDSLDLSDLSALSALSDLSALTWVPREAKGTIQEALVNRPALKGGTPNGRSNVPEQ